MTLKAYKQKVYEILERYPDTRNCDNKLFAKYLEVHYGFVLPPKLVDEMPPIESILRPRRIIQNNNQELLPTSNAVRKARKIKEKNMREVEIGEAGDYNVKAERPQPAPKPPNVEFIKQGDRTVAVVL